MPSLLVVHHSPTPAVRRVIDGDGHEQHEAAYELGGTLAALVAG